jgi:hypothetical protein
MDLWDVLSMGFPGSYNGVTVPYKANILGYIPLHKPET